MASCIVFMSNSLLLGVAFEGLALYGEAFARPARQHPEPGALERARGVWVNFGL